MKIIKGLSSMENAITAALSKQIVLTRALDIAANNIANQTTAGFKSEKARFGEYVAIIPGGAREDRTVSLVHDVDSVTDFSPGGLQQTQSPLDFAIDGDGFFAIETADGIQYTRNGHFALNDFGELVDAEGAQVLGDGGAPILIDPESGPLRVAENGEIEQNGALVGRLGVFAFDDLSILRRGALNRFSADIAPEPAQNVKIRQGFVEISNVAPITAMTDMISIMRAYENAAQVLQASSELSRDAVRTLTDPA